MALCVRGQREDHDTRCVAIKAVDEENLRIDRLEPRDQAICQVRPLTGNRQQSRRLVHDEDLVIGVKDIERGIRRSVFIAHSSGTPSEMS